MTIKQIAHRIIKDIKTWPVKEKSTSELGGPKTWWDEYKEQIQYEEYESFEIFEETIESLVRDKVAELSLIVIDKMFRSIYDNYIPINFEEKRKDIVGLVLSHIKSEAKSQDIEYTKPDIEFVRYYIYDLIIVSEVLAQVSPEEYLIHAFSEVTGANGEQGVVNLSTLDEQNGLERITVDEFIKTRNALSPNFKSNCNPIQANMGKESASRDKTESLILQESNKYIEDEKIRIKKTIIDLVRILAKVKKQSPKEILLDMKETLDKRKTGKPGFSDIQVNPDNGTNNSSNPKFESGGQTGTGNRPKPKQSG